MASRLKSSDLAAQQNSLLRVSRDHNELMRTSAVFMLMVLIPALQSQERTLLISS
jgi:hypothetical protein